MNKHQNFHDWLISEGQKSVNLVDLLDKFCKFLNLQSFRIKRATMALGTLNPQTEALRYVWFNEVTDPGPFPAPTLFYRKIHHTNDSTIDEAFMSFGCKDTPVYKASPFHYVDIEDKELHLPIKYDGEQQHYPLFDDLAKLGCTDYFCYPINTNEHAHAQISLVTDYETGFTEHQLEQLRRWLPYFSMLKDNHRQQLITRTLLDVYLGMNPGKQVLNGTIKPGEVKSIEAAIWYSDLRGFTSMAQDIAPETLVSWINSYFEILVKNIYQHDGEILKYIGDAVLAIFPIERFNSMSQAADHALQCAIDCNQHLQQLNIERVSNHYPQIEHGIALHIGDLLYGNIGALKRLDFTVVGTTVNLVARLEGLCAELQENIICSEEFANLKSMSYVNLGEHLLKGFTDSKIVFKPVVETQVTK